jgi:LEA14-like dessication related protein
MRRAPRSRPAVLLCVTLLAGCARLEPPIVKVQSAKMLKLGIAGSTLALDLRVQNPNTRTLRVERFEYAVSVNDVALGRGFHADPVTIEGFREASVRTNFELSMLSIPGTVKSIIERGEARARIRGTVHLAGGPRTVPFEGETLIDLPGEGRAPGGAPPSP